MDALSWIEGWMERRSSRYPIGKISLDSMLQELARY